MQKLFEIPSISEEFCHQLVYEIMTKDFDDLETSLYLTKFFKSKFKLTVSSNEHFFDTFNWIGNDSFNLKDNNSQQIIKKFLNPTQKLHIHQLLFIKNEKKAYNVLLFLIKLLEKTKDIPCVFRLREFFFTVWDIFLPGGESTYKQGRYHLES